MSAIDFRTLPTNVPVMCIPRVFPNIDEKRIRRIFDELNMGQIERVDIIGKSTEKGEKFNRVFVHFRRWFSNANADTARERLINGKEIKIIYDEPWFWKVSAYRETEKPQRAFPPAQKRPPTLQFDDDEAQKPIAKDEFGRDISLKPATNHRHNNNRKAPVNHPQHYPIAPAISTEPPQQAFQVKIPVKKRNFITKKPEVKKVLEEGEIEE
jgi:hypothetical protein